MCSYGVVDARKKMVGIDGNAPPLSVHKTDVHLSHPTPCLCRGSNPQPAAPVRRSIPLCQISTEEQSVIIYGGTVVYA